MFKAEIKYAGKKPSEEMHLEGSVVINKETGERNGTVTKSSAFNMLI